MKSPNLKLHIRKTNAWTSKKFTTMAKILDYTIPSILVSQETSQSAILKVHLSMQNIYCISNSIPKLQILLLLQGKQAASSYV